MEFPPMFLLHKYVCFIIQCTKMPFYVELSRYLATKESKLHFLKSDCKIVTSDLECESHFSGVRQ